MKKLFTSIILLITIGYILTNANYLMRLVMEKIIYKDEKLIKENNEYYKDINWEYVKITDNFYPTSKQEILNIFYTALNGGWDEVTYYCDKSYKDCLSDTEEMTNDNYILSNINNFVATYNSYNKIYVNYNTLGRVNITFQRIYSDEHINLINERVDKIISENINDKMTDEEKIKIIHDYIINNTRYDEERAIAVKSGTYDSLLHASNTAYGTLFNGKAICGGYTDTMAIFLDKLGFKNYKISSSKHIWNLVYINGEWRHLDLTWDDPVTNTGVNRLEHNFFLITDKELTDKNTGQHDYDKNIYLELK